MARPKKEKPNSRGLFEVKKPVTDPVTGAKKYKSFTSKVSKAEALKKYEEYQVQQALKLHKIYIEEENITFGAVARTVLELKKGTIKDQTWELKWRNIFEKYLIPHFGESLIKNIRKNDIEIYIKLHSKGLAKTSLQVHLQDLNAVFRSAVENGYIDRNPCDGVKVREGKKSAEKHVYTEEEAEYILKYCLEHRYGLEIHLLLQYGMSRSELLAITRDCIDYDKKILKIEKGLITMNKSVTGESIVVSETKNKYRNRLVPLSDTTIELLKKNDTGCRFVVHTKEGTSIRSDSWYHRHYEIFMRDMREHYLKQGIDIPVLHPHELRHTRASIWINKGLNLYAIAEIMGWADLDMLRKRYGHGDISELRTLVDL